MHTHAVCTHTHTQYILARRALKLVCLSRSLALWIPYGAFVRKCQICVSYHCYSCLNVCEWWGLVQSLSSSTHAHIGQGRCSDVHGNSSSVLQSFDWTFCSSSVSWRHLTQQATSPARKQWSGNILFMLTPECERSRRCTYTDQQSPCHGTGEGAGPVPVAVMACQVARASFPLSRMPLLCMFTL